jgi:MFS family permease
LSGEQKCKLWESGNCQPRYEADRETTVTEWNLICGDSWKKGLPVSAVFVGFGIGNWASGLLSDQIGRRHVLLGSSILAGAAALLTSFTWSLLSYTVARFFQGMTGGNILPISFVLIGELVGSGAREVCGNIVQSMFTAGLLLLCCLALTIKNWRNLITVVSLLGLSVTSIFWRHIPESPRWLLIQGQTKECELQLKSIAKINGRPECDIHLNNSETHATKLVGKAQQGSEGALDLFRNVIMRKRMIIMLYYWFVASAVYYGLSMNARIGPNIYVTFFGATIVEFPGYVASSYFLRKLGRRKSTACFTLLGCVSLVLCAFLSSSSYPNSRALLSFNMLAKFGLSTTFANIYVYGSELVPTSLRNTAIGLLSVGARVAGVLLPYIMMLDQVYKPLPFVVFFLLSLLAVLAGLQLPETLNKDLPQTLDDVSG